MNLLNLLGVAGPRQSMGLGALLGNDPNELPPVGQQPAAPETVGQQDIVATGSRIPRMSPEALGMPGIGAMRSADPEATGDLRQALKDKARMARDLYHKGSEFGTQGLLRDVIGNTMDFGRRLLGFSPRYNDEKWSERAYGMTSSDPAVAAAAREQAMQYNPEKTMAYAKQLDAARAQEVSSAATASYRDSMAASRNSQLLTGLGAGLMSINNPAGAEEQYQRSLPAIRNAYAAVYGDEAAATIPEHYDANFVASLAKAGFSGTNYQRQEGNVLDNNTRLEVANGRNLTALEVARINADARRYAADAVYRAAVNRAAVTGQPIETIVETEQTGSIVRPGEIKRTTVTRANGQQPQRKLGPDGKWYIRGPDGKARLAQ